MAIVSSVRDDAPLVALDSGVLIDIADGTRPADDVNDIHDAMRDVGALLLVVPPHLSDLWPSTDTATRSRWQSAINAFPRKAVTLVLPAAAEKAALDAALAGCHLPPQEPDLIIEEVVIFRLEDLVDGETDRLLTTQGGFASRSAEAQQVGHDAARADGHDQRTNVDNEFVAKVVEDLLAGRDLASMLAPHALVPDDFQLLAANLPQLVSVLRSQIERHGGDARRAARALALGKSVSDLSWAATKGGHERWLALAPDIAPGEYLAYELRRRRDADHTRKSRASDLADLEHVKVVPYVDLATLDRENWAVIEELVKKVRRRRQAHVVPNGASDLAARIRQLPHHRGNDG